VNIDRKGYALLHLDKYDEDYLITMPKIHVEGFMTGSLFPELQGSSYIRSSTGYTAKIDYISKGWLSGRRNGFVANLFHDKYPEDAIYTAEGQWSGAYVIKEIITQREIEKFDINAVKMTPLSVYPIEEQHPLESRRAWQHVAAAIYRGDILAAGHEKSKIENEQRERRKIEKSLGEEYPRRYFTRAEGNPRVEELAGGIPGQTSIKGDFDGTHGLWVWDEAKYQKVVSNHLHEIQEFDEGEV
jgi:hypothetical protein